MNTIYYNSAKHAYNCLPLFLRGLHLSYRYNEIRCTFLLHHYLDFFFSKIKKKIIKKKLLFSIIFLFPVFFTV